MCFLFVDLHGCSGLASVSNACFPLCFGFLVCGAPVEPLDISWVQIILESLGVVGKEETAHQAATGASNVEVRTTAAHCAGPIFSSQAGEVYALCQTFQQKVNRHCAVDGFFHLCNSFV